MRGNAMSNKEEWERLRDQYPPLEIEFDKEERTAFDRWVEGMGYDGIIQITGKDNDKDKTSS
jgi:hypothetical protein